MKVKFVHEATAVVSLDHLASAVIDSPLGPLTISCTLREPEGALQSIRFGDYGSFLTEYPALQLVVTELNRYFAGKAPTNELTVHMDCTAFTLNVYRSLCRTGAGEVVSYGQLATMAGRPGAARAVGTAMKRNPLPLVIPCHRVVAAAGIGGFASGIERKKMAHPARSRSLLPQ